MPAKVACVTSHVATINDMQSTNKPTALLLGCLMTWQAKKEAKTKKKKVAPTFIAACLPPKDNGRMDKHNDNAGDNYDDDPTPDDVQVICCS